MTRPTEILMAEHRVIEQMLGCLEAIAGGAQKSGRIDVPDARDAIAFLRTFADGCHHKKEEDRLFPALESHGLPPGAGPTAVMRHEHELGRAHIRGMDDAVTAFERGDASGARRFAGEARGFVALLHDHIAKEEQVLFPMADRMLPEAVQQKVLAGFEHAEREELPAGTHEKFLAVADRLGAKHGVARTGHAGPSCGCSHGH